jgi:hypothetical protein
MVTYQGWFAQEIDRRDEPVRHFLKRHTSAGLYPGCELNMDFGAP